MLRSVKGLEGAGERHMLKEMIPSLKGKRVLDLGCGFGWHCRYAVEQGAEYVLGVDISQNMIDKALKINNLPEIDYVCEPIEDIALTDGSFDVVVSSLALHYIENFRAMAEKIYRALTTDGIFVMSVEHPVFTAQGDQQWYCNENGDRLHWPVDRYFEEGVRTASFLDEPVVKYHRTMTTYIKGLLGAGFALSELQEAKPDARMLESFPEMADELRRPMMLLISATKK